MIKRIVPLALALALAAPGPARAAWQAAGAGTPAGRDAAAAERIRRVETGLRPPFPVESEPAWTIEDRLRHYKIPGVSVAVIDDFKIVWAKGYGLADVAARRPVTAETRFQAASISKPVTAVAAMRMVRAGQLALDRPVNEQLASWKLPENELTRATPVTLRHLLSHSAGTSVHGFPGYPVTAKPPAIVGVLDGEGNTAPVRVDLAPGTRFRYSGGGTSVVQLLMADVAGKPFPELMASLVLRPLGMTSSTYEQPLPERLAPEAATAYRANGSPVEGRYHVYPEMAAAGLWTTPTDLARLLVHLQTALAGRDDKTYLTREAVTEMIDARFDMEPGGTGYKMGLGPMVRERFGQRYFGHGGSNEGYRCFMLASATEGKGVVVMTNSDNGDGIVPEIVDAVAREYEWGYAERVVKSVAVPAGRLRSYEGRYQVGEDEIAAVRADGGRLVVEGLGRATTLHPVEQATFMRTDSGERYEFGEKDGALALTVWRGERPTVARRVGPDVRAGSELLWTGKADEGAAVYRALRKERPDSPLVAEARLNVLGYALLGGGQTASAVALLALVTELYPTSSNAYDSLADARLAAGDRAGAAEAYRKVLEVLPKDHATPESVKAQVRANAERFLGVKKK